MDGHARPSTDAKNHNTLSERDRIRAEFKRLVGEARARSIQEELANLSLAKTTTSKLLQLAQEMRLLMLRQLLGTGENYKCKPRYNDYDRSAHDDLSGETSAAAIRNVFQLVRPDSICDRSH